MSKFQVFLIVLYLFFFGGVGGWVLELLFRRFFSGANPERKWLNPGAQAGIYAGLGAISPSPPISGA